MNKQRSPLRVLKYLSLMTEIGFTMVANIVLGLFIGNKVDQWLGTSPLFLFIFIILGVFSGIKVIHSLIKRLG